MKQKQVLAIAIVLSLAGTGPKIIRKPIIDPALILFYFFYIFLCITSFYATNKFLWRVISFNRAVKFVAGFLCGALGLLCLHCLLLFISPSSLFFFLNIETPTFTQLLFITLYRTLIIQSVAFVCLLYLKNASERKHFQREVNQLAVACTNADINTLIPVYKETVIVRFRDQVLPIKVTEIAFFYLAEGVVLQYLFSSDQYVQSKSLDVLERELDPALFYRANRRFIISKRAVKNIEYIENRKLRITISLYAPVEIIVSKAKATKFIKWVATN